MTAPIEVVSEVEDESFGTWTWRALSGGEEIGSASTWVRPDGRCMLSGAKCEPEGRAPLLDAINARHSDLCVSANEKDAEAIALYRELGFTTFAREQTYLISVPDAVRALASAGVPPEVTVLSPDTADLDRLRLLDDALRDDVPGTAGWRWSDAAFRDETFGPQYDPALYAVAARGDEYIGIVRAWNRLPRPRLGLIGVVRQHRRRGLASGLLAQVVEVLHARGVGEITAEVDVTNVASNALVTSLGAKVIGSHVDLVRRSGQIQPA